MQCTACGATLSAFDVHCGACGAPIVPQDLDQQLAALGSDLANNPNPGEVVSYVPTPIPADKHLLGTVLRAASAGMDAVYDVTRIAAGGELEDQVHLEHSIERAIRRSRR